MAHLSCLLPSRYDTNIFRPNKPAKNMRQQKSNALGAGGRGCESCHKKGYNIKL